MSNSTSSSVPSGMVTTSLPLTTSTSSIVTSSSTPPLTTSSSSTSISSTTTTSIPTPSTTTILTTATLTTSDSLSTTPVTTITRTSTSTPTSVTFVQPSTTTAGSSSTTSPASLQSSGNNGNGGGGLSTAGKTAIAVVVPVAVVALLVLAGILLWRKRKQKKEAEEARRKEIQDYGYNPNDDPTLPTVMQETNSEMAEDTSGYRGWGAAAGSNRKTSTTLSGGLTHAQMSDSGSNIYGASPHSPGMHASDNQSGDPLMTRRETMGSDDLGALGVAPITTNQPIRRGPSNASSAYSNGARSDHSDDQPPVPGGTGYGYYDSAGGQYGYTQHGPYGDGSYGGGPDTGMPVVRDVSARRNTRIQQGGTYQQGNSGIAQNF